MITFASACIGFQRVLALRNSILVAMCPIVIHGGARIVTQRVFALRFGRAARILRLAKLSLISVA